MRTTSWLLDQVMRRVAFWMEDHNLELTAAKTEIVLLTKRHIDTKCPLRVGDATVRVKASAKYLGVMLDSYNKLTFRKHDGKAADKAASVVAALSRIMANGAEGPMR